MQLVGRAVTEPSRMAPKLKHQSSLSNHAHNQFYDGLYTDTLSSVSSGYVLYVNASPTHRPPEVNISTRTLGAQGRRSRSGLMKDDSNFWHSGPDAWNDRENIQAGSQTPPWPLFSVEDQASYWAV